MIDKDLEHLYSPSAWSKRFPADQVVPKHTEIVTQESERVSSSVPNNRGIRYGPGDHQKYDLFGGDSLPPDAPLLVYIHGGYWQALSREISAYCVAPLYKAGIRVAILGYTLAPEVTVEQIVEEIRTGLRIVTSQAAEMGCRGVWVAGHSAGAHLTVMATLCTGCDATSGLQLVKGIIPISGVFHLAPLVKTTINEALGLDKERATRLSPLALLAETRLSASARRLHVLVVVAEHDSPAFIQQSREFATTLENRVAHVELLELQGLDHFDIVENLMNSDYVLVRRITSLIKNNK